MDQPLHNCRFFGQTCLILTLTLTLRLSFSVPLRSPADTLIAASHLAAPWRPDGGDRSGIM